MAWKPKEKPLTLEEAIAAARKELAPHWFSSEPLFMGVRSANGVATVHPLSPVFQQKIWLVVFLDPTDFQGQALLAFVREWSTRYRELSLEPLLVFRFPYRKLAGLNFIKQLIRDEGIDFPAVFDADGLISAAFGAETDPKAILFQQGARQFVQAGADLTEQTESRIQDFLRRSNPGLPLLSPYRVSAKLMEPSTRIELGKGRGARFSPQVKPGEICLRGSWQQDDERISTSDPRAELVCCAGGTRFSLVAQSLGKTAESAKIRIEVDEKAPFESNAGEAISVDEDGHAMILVQEGKLYSGLIGLAGTEEIVLRFPFADQVSLAIYGLRF